MAALLKKLAADTATDVSVKVEKGDDPEAGMPDDANDDNLGITLDNATLQKRVALLRQLLPVANADIRQAFAEQLAKIANLPADLRDGMLVTLKSAPGLGAIAARAAACRNADVRENGLLMLGETGDAALAALLKEPPAQATFDPYKINRALAVAVAGYAQHDMVKLGAAKVADWDKQENAIKIRYTGGPDFSPAAPEQPCLDSESLYARIGWLAYLSRWEPDTYLPRFVREWMLIEQYAEYARTIMSGLARDTVLTETQKKGKMRDLTGFIDALSRLDRATTPALERAFAAHPELVAQGFTRARYLHEADRAIVFLGNHPAADSRAALAIVATAKMSRLAEFAKARLQAVP